MRFRNLALVGGSLALFAYTGITHPGAETLQDHLAILIATLANLAFPTIAVLFTYIARKALTDYIDLEVVFKRAMKTPIGAGLVFLGTCILMFGLLGLFGTKVNAQPVTTYIPAQAQLYLPVLKAEQIRLWPTHPKITCSEVSSSTNLA